MRFKALLAKKPGTLPSCFAVYPGDMCVGMEFGKWNDAKEVISGPLEIPISWKGKRLIWYRKRSWMMQDTIGYRSVACTTQATVGYSWPLSKVALSVAFCAHKPTLDRSDRSWKFTISSVLDVQKSASMMLGGLLVMGIDMSKGKEVKVKSGFLWSQVVNGLENDATLFVSWYLGEICEEGQQRLKPHFGQSSKGFFNWKYFEWMNLLQIGEIWWEKQPMLKCCQPQQDMHCGWKWKWRSFGFGIGLLIGPPASRTRLR